MHEVEFFRGPQDGAKHVVPDNLNEFYFAHLDPKVIRPVDNEIVSSAMPTIKSRYRRKGSSMQFYFDGYDYD